MFLDDLMDHGIDVDWKIDVQHKMMFISVRSVMIPR